MTRSDSTGHAEPVETLPPLPLGTVVSPWGTILGIRFRNGERYYLMGDESCAFAYLPDFVVREAVAAAKGEL